MTSGIQWGLLCGIAGIIGAAVWIAIDAVQGQRAERFEIWLYGVVRRSRQPRLYRFVLVARWVMVGMFGTGALVLARIFDLIAMRPPI